MAHAQSKCTWQPAFLSRTEFGTQIKHYLNGRDMTLLGCFKEHIKELFVNKSYCCKCYINLEGLELLFNMQLGYVTINGKCQDIAEYIFFLFPLSFQEVKMLISVHLGIKDQLSLFFCSSPSMLSHYFNILPMQIWLSFTQIQEFHANLYWEYRLFLNHRRTQIIER